MNVKPFRRCGAIVACLFVARAFLGCHPAPGAAVHDATAGRSPRPIDADPLRAEIIGREALATIGYIPIMDLARRAGWVTSKERESSPGASRAFLSMDGATATAAKDFVEVFSQYAVTAGVTSQADSPLPGPADAAAIGILVIGLIDAGLLEGALLVSLGELVSDITPSTTLALPVAKTLSMTAAPTATAPPVAITRRNPGQTCDDKRLDELQKQKNTACKKRWSCDDDEERIGKDKIKLFTCAQLLIRIASGQGCLAARKLVQSECFAGSPEAGHEKAIKEISEGVGRCIGKASVRGPGGGPC